jgi:hypothetical protein
MNFSRVLSFLLVLAAGPAVAQAPAPSVDYFVGTWANVTYNDSNDLPRMITVARGYCNLPYRIERRSADTFAMYVAEDLREVRLMQQQGHVYIVPTEAENNVLRGAREVTIRDANTFMLRYIENARNAQYGLNVFVRCGGAAARPQRRR